MVPMAPPRIPLSVSTSRLGTSLRRRSSDVGETETGGGVGETEMGASSLQQEWVEPWADMRSKLVEVGERSGKRGCG
jgi:hypothetical protein